MRATDRGQASVELLAGLPALGLAALIAVQLLLAGYSLTIADGAAEAGAIAGAAGLDATDAARDALPEWARGRATVTASGGEVRVQLRPPSPLASIPEALANTIAVDARFRKHRSFVDRSHNAILHYKFPVDHHTLNIGSLCRIDQLRIDIVERRLVRTAHPDDDHISALAGFKGTYLFVHVNCTGSANRGHSNNLLCI